MSNLEKTKRKKTRGTHEKARAARKGAINMHKKSGGGNIANRLGKAERLPGAAREQRR